MVATCLIGEKVKMKTKGIGEKVCKKTKGKGEKVRKKTKETGVKVRKITKEKPYLPDDIIPNILCRLPAKNASQCRLVCKGWRDLTLTPDFVDLHFRHSFPMIMVADRRDLCIGKFDHFLLDKWWETARRKLMNHTFLFHSKFEALFSHAGLIVFRNYGLPIVIVVNPISFEKVIISLSNELARSYIYGVFFHPSLKEYCSLWRIEASRTTWDQPELIHYKILNLGSSPFMKTICNPFSHRVKQRDSQPLFIDKYLYWMLEYEGKQGSQYNGRNDIMQFDIIGEEFRVKPCPVPVNTGCNWFHTHILNIDGALSFLAIFPSKITIWRLEDHAKQLWTTTNYKFISRNFEYIPKPIAVVDGNLALLSERRLFGCNLVEGTTKCFRKRKYYENVLVLSHQMSLASLRNCRSTIYIDEEGKVDFIGNSLTSCRVARMAMTLISRRANIDDEELEKKDSS